MEAIELTSKEVPGIVSLVWIHDYHLTLVPSILRQVCVRLIFVISISLLIFLVLVCIRL